MENKFFLTRIRRTSNAWDKGVEVHDTIETAKGAYYAYLGAFGYSRNEETDFCSALISDMTGAIIVKDTWIKAETKPVQEQLTIEIDCDLTELGKGWGTIGKLLGNDQTRDCNIHPSHLHHLRIRNDHINIHEHHNHIL